MDRTFKKITPAVRAMEGAGVRLKRAFGGISAEFDPFLLFDDFSGEHEEEYVAGFPGHPHRGMETVTYILEGEVRHRDILGNEGVIGAGDIQWMSAGSGIMHEEMPQGAGEKEGMKGFQLWVNLPRDKKMLPPQYREIKSRDVPLVEREGVRVRVLGGVVMSDAVPQLLPAISATLPQHTCYFRPHLFDFYGLALFIKKDVQILEEGELYVHKHKGFVESHDWGTHARNIQYVTVQTEAGVRTVINFHGLWNGKGKRDTEERLLQSANICTFIETLAHPFILCGDFNLHPDTESLKKLEEFPLRNLIKEYGITSTRTRLYTKEEKFADYAFASNGIEIADFRVLHDVVSDHAPLFLEWR